MSDRPGAAFGIPPSGWLVSTKPDGTVTSQAYRVPTDKEREAERERARAWHARRVEAQQRMLDRLRAIRDDATAIVVELHEPSRPISEWPYCLGCDFSGYEGEPPEWPCRTILALAEVHNIPSEEIG